MNKNAMRRTWALVAVLLSACGSSSEVSLAPPGGSGADDVPLAEWQPLPAVSSLQIPAEVQQARDEILGPDATDPAYVKLWWFGVSSFIATAGGHLFLFDAWEPVGVQNNYVPIGREELAAIRPEVIMLGHGHFDHAADTGYVAARTGAAVVGSAEICALAREQAADDGGTENFRCLLTGTMSTPPPGTTQSVKLWADMPDVQILQHLHSAATPTSPGVPFIHVPDLLTYLLYLNTDPQEILRFLRTVDDPQGGTWAYHLRVGDFSLLWHDSTGPIETGLPSASEIQQALNAFPGCVDVQVGAIVGFDQPISGLRDPRLYVEHAHPRVSLPSHHDAWAPVIGGGAAAYENQWRIELATLENPPELDYLRDPIDYMKVRAYRVDDPVWKEPMPGSSCAGGK